MKFSITIFCLISFLTVNAQIVIEGKLFIEEASTMYIGSDVVLNGSLDNKGVLTLTGNLNSTGSFITTGTGSLLLTGQGQTFSGGNYAFSTLKMSEDYISLFDNAGQISVTDSLILRNGIVTFNSGGQMNLLNSTVIVGGSDLAFIDGPLFHEGVGDKFFPIGTEGDYMPMYLNSNSNKIGVRAKKPIYANSIGDKVFSISEDRLWELMGDQVDVSAVNSVQLPIKDETFIKNFFDVIVTAAEAEDGVFRSQGRIDLVETDRWRKEGYVTANLSGYSPFISLGEKTNHSISIKNMITPNGDGKNDYLYIENIEKFTDYVIVVLNGWGQEVFRSSNYSNNWDTIYNGQLLVTGAYTCVVTLKEDGNSNTISNIVNVISK